MGPAAVTMGIRGINARLSCATCPGGDQATGSRVVMVPAKR